MRRILFVLSGILLASLAVSAETIPPQVDNPEATTPFSGDTTGGPTWYRAGTLGTGASGSCLIATLEQVSTEAIAFHVDTTGLYTIFSAWDGFDGFLNLYETAFDPLDQCLNLIALDDDGYSWVNSEIVDVSLTAGVQYFLIANGISAADEGPYAGTFNGVGTTILGVVGVLFTDGFDTGDTCNWSSATSGCP